MRLAALSLQNFRNYEHQTFYFPKLLTIIVGPNASGKSNLIEAVNILSSGKSFHADHDVEMLAFGKEVARVKGKITDVQEGAETLEFLLAHQEGRLTKKYLVNGISRRRVDFAGRVPSVLFLPSDIDIVIGSPGMRRRFLDSVLEQTDREYRIHLTAYEKALRRRNKLLEQVRETGRRDARLFPYWDELVIENGRYITKARQAFLEFINAADQATFPVQVEYDRSEISEERLWQYRQAEVGAGVTLVGPHRDDIVLMMENSETKRRERIKAFGSRGQQRLAVLQLKMLQMEYIEGKTGERPLLLLDDIFSELDEGHMELLTGIMGKQQTIVTTTHKEFVGAIDTLSPDIIELT